MPSDQIGVVGMEGSRHGSRLSCGKGTEPRCRWQSLHLVRAQRIRVRKCPN